MAKVITPIPDFEIPSKIKVTSVPRNSGNSVLSSSKDIKKKRYRNPKKIGSV